MPNSFKSRSRQDATATEFAFPITAIARINKSRTVDSKKTISNNYNLVFNENKSSVLFLFAGIINYSLMKT
jgi:hypothetical protein